MSSRALGAPWARLHPIALSALRRVATIESIGSSTRIEGSKLSDREVEQLLSNLEIKSFATRDEQEVAGYAELMDLVFSSWQDIPFTENHIKQLHQILLRHSEKDAWHRGQYKTNSNSVAAFDETGDTDRHRLSDCVAVRHAPPDGRTGGLGERGAGDWASAPAC
jgi:Fic family protein